MQPNESKTVFTIAQILSLFTMERDEIGVREASQILGLSPGKVHRLLSSLGSCGFLEQNAHRKYRLGEKIFSIGSLYPLHFPLRKVVRPHAEELARMYDAGVHFAILSKNPPYSAVIIDRIINLQSSSAIHRITFNIPLHASAVGKSILAFLAPAEQKKILSDLILTKFTAHTITTMDRLLSELKQTKKDGFSMDRGETHLNLVCVGAPIFQENRVVGALSLTDFTETFDVEKLKEIGIALKERTAFISRQL
ncbi:MAG: IclR family transcriptional regulator [Thermodesulfobacteriota bacterium]